MIRKTKPSQDHWLFGLAACLNALRIPLTVLILGLFGALSPPTWLSMLILRALRW